MPSAVQTMSSPRMSLAAPTIAVLIPCLNEEAAIGTVVADFRRALPSAAIWVFDNRSSDSTATVARAAGAEVRHVAQRGKGNVVRRMFADVEADVYVLVDGDSTYDASAAPNLIRCLTEGGLDMVVASRKHDEAAAYRLGHRAGNRIFNEFVGWLFGRGFSDVFSGYRAFSRRFVKSFPALATGFEIETELTIHALELRMPVEEIEAHYKARPDGSESKLRTYRDGLRILWTIVRLFQRERPFQFFGSASLMLAAIAVGIAIPLFVTYVETGLVPRFPTAILASGMMLLSALSAVCGIILDTVSLSRLETRRLAYLNVARRS